RPAHQHAGRTGRFPPVNPPTDSKRWYWLRPPVRRSTSRWIARRPRGASDPSATTVDNTQDSSFRSPVKFILFWPAVLGRFAPFKGAKLPLREDALREQQCMPPTARQERRDASFGVQR